MNILKTQTQFDSFKKQVQEVAAPTENQEDDGPLNVEGATQLAALLKDSTKQIFTKRT